MLKQSLALAAVLGALATPALAQPYGDPCEIYLKCLVMCGTDQYGNPNPSCSACIPPTTEVCRKPGALPKHPLAMIRRAKPRFTPMPATAAFEHLPDLSEVAGS